MTDQIRKPCPLCEKPLATEEDRDTYGDGEGLHLCWSFVHPRHCEMAGRERQIIAKLRAEKDRLKEYEPRLISFEGGEFKLSVAHEVMANLVCAFDELNGDANYTTLTMRPKASGREYLVTVQRNDKPTPHQFRMKAEAENAKLIRAVRELHWTARRYCDGRSTGVTGTFNRITRELLAAGVDLPTATDGTPWARDAMGRQFDGLTAEEAAMGRKPNPTREAAVESAAKRKE